MKLMGEKLIWKRKVWHSKHKIAKMKKKMGTKKKNWMRRWLSLSRGWIEWWAGRTLAREGNHQGKILLLTRLASNVVKWVISSSIVQTRKMTRTKRTKKIMRRRRSSSRRRKMAKPILSSGILMQWWWWWQAIKGSCRDRHQGGSITLLHITLSYGKRWCKEKRKVEGLGVEVWFTPIFLWGAKDLSSEL